MKVTLIYPSIGKKQDQDYVKSWEMEPLVMALLKSLTPSWADVEFYDDRIDTIPFDKPTDLAAISIESYTAKRAYQIAAEFRKRGVKVVIGGYHATFCPDEVLEYADSVVIGEAEDAWEQILTDAKENKLQKKYQAEQKPSLKGIMPDRSIFKDKSYFKWLSLVETGRGCKFFCDFCSITSFHKASYRRRPIRDIVQEIKKINKKGKTLTERIIGRLIFFVDDNIAGDIDSAKELVKALIPLKIKWISQVSIDVADNDELLELMRKSGCTGVLVGFESLKKENLEQMGKGHNIRSDYKHAMKKFRDYGIVIYGTFVVGYGADNKHDFQQAVDFAKQVKMFIVAFNHVQPFPGTKLYQKLEKSGLLRYPKWWLSSDYTFGEVAFNPQNMTHQELTDLCISSRKDFYSIKSILKRCFDFKGNCRNYARAAIFLLSNFLLRKEIDQKKGIPLGSSA